MLPWRAATIVPSSSLASTSAFGPTDVMIGARMKIARIGFSPIAGIRRSVSKLWIYRPNALRLTTMSIVPISG